MIPKLIHFVFGFSTDVPGTAIFGIHHYIAVKSAALRHPNHKLVMWAGSEPEGNIFWELAKRHFEKIMVQPPTGIYGRPLIHYAHKADVFRLFALRDHGGIYLDCDTITLRSFEPICCTETVMGPEWDPLAGRVKGLCNATIMARRGANFISRWLDTFEFFNSTGDDRNFELHGVIMPLILARQYSWDIAIAPRNHFFKFDWSGKMLEELFAGNTPVDDCYSIHLWELLASDYVRALTVERIFTVDSTYNCASRNVIGSDYDEILENAPRLHD